MRRGLAIGMLGLAVVFGPAIAQAPPKDLQWTHAFDLACRKNGEADFSPTTQRFGIEALRDPNAGLGLYVSERGSIALAGGFAGLSVPLAAKGPGWLTGLDLPARRAGQKEFDKTVKVHSLEVFRDPNTENFLYITEKGLVAATSAAGRAAGTDAAPKWAHSVDLSVRKGGIREWKDAPKIGVEIYRDRNTSSLVYISETGSVAVVPETKELVASDKAPAWLHGLDLAVRRASEPTFSKDTRRYGVEVFREEASENLIFVCESGSIAVLPGGAKLPAPTPNAKEPTWTHGWNVKARKYGEKDFSATTQVYGGEAFVDDNLGAVIYVSEMGSIAVQAKK